EERHDSDGEESFMADSKTKGSNVGCSSEAGKRRRLVLDSSKLVSQIWSIWINNKGSGQGLNHHQV
ncbi:hypothetical protein Tco_1332802, partial [Tanacetum coccineum]